MAQHDGFGFQTADADGDDAQCIHVRGVRVGADTGIREGNAIAGLNHRRHLLQVDLVHDAVTGRNHVHVLERGLGPVDEMETVFVATVFDGAVLFERIRIETGGFNGQRVVNDQLSRHHRVHLGRITALLGDGVTQTGQVDQCSLTQNVMADHTGRIPGEVQIALALDQLLQGIGQGCGFAATHQLLRQHTRSVGQLGIGTGLDRFNRRTGVKVVEVSTVERLAKFCIHGVGSPSSSIH